jgi:Cdc6-like AAA superfamily ATPase
VAAELASAKKETLTVQHVDLASERLQKDRIDEVLSSASYHFRLACLSLAMKTYGLEIELHSTHDLHKKYCDLIQKGTKPVSHRRFSEILREIENTGLAVSHTGSQGRKGYSSQFRLVMPPEIVGKACFPDYWKKVEEKKQSRKDLERSIASSPKNSPFKGLDTIAKTLLQDDSFFG